jgi:NAD(P)-dependent dehydrogenase (short-subunit alcohol dehydrogenase family)
MDLKLKGKNVILFGGNSNIGRATSLAFGQEGANILIAARDIEAATKICKEAKESGSERAECIKCDATKWEDVEAVIEKAKTLGSIDIVYHGVAWDVFSNFEALNPELWDKIIEVNFKSVLIAYKKILPVMKTQRKGCFITISSAMGRRPTSIECLYGACKAALIYLNHTLAEDYGPYGVRLNVVAPGPTPPPNADYISKGSNFREFMKDMDNFKKLEAKFASEIPLRKTGTPWDNAYAVLFLASEVTGSHQTGQVLGVDGGWYMPH